MKRLFDEYGTLLLEFVCSTIGFNILYNILINGNYVHNLISHSIYGIL